MGVAGFMSKSEFMLRRRRDMDEAATKAIEVLLQQRRPLTARQIVRIGEINVDGYVLAKALGQAPDVYQYRAWRHGTPALWAHAMWRPIIGTIDGPDDLPAGSMGKA